MASIPVSAAKREGATQAAAERVRCWQCGTDHAPDLFCPACGIIQPLPDRTDYFQVLGLPHQLVIDNEALQRRYYALNRRLHPDLYQTGAPMAREASLRNTAAVNRAYRTLRDPVERGLYWLRLQGETLGANNNRVPPELAALVFDVQEKLDELRAARGQPGHAALVEEVAAVRAALAAREAALTAELHENFRRWDTQPMDGPSLTRELKTILSNLAYVGTLIRDVDKELQS